MGDVSGETIVGLWSRSSLGDGDCGEAGGGGDACICMRVANKRMSFWGRARCAGGGATMPTPPIVAAADGVRLL